MQFEDKIILTDAEYLVQKFQYKGGWHYVLLHDLDLKSSARSGMIKVIAIINNSETIEQNIMPFGNGKFFLSLNTQLRTKTGIKEGDTIRLKLYADKIEDVGVDDFYLCLKDDKTAFENFYKLSATKQNEIVDNIKNAKTNDAKIQRIAMEVNRLVN